MREPIGCNDAEAQRYLGCTDWKWVELKARRIVVPLVRGWYSYADLDHAMDQLRAERDQNAKIIRFPRPKNESNPQKRRKIRGQRSQPRGETEELLWPNGRGGGAQSAG